MVERVAVVPAVANQSSREVGEEAGVESGGDEVRSYGEALATWMATGRPWRSQIAMILLPLPRRVGPTAAPPFLPGERGVDEGFGQINLAAVAQIFGEPLQQ